MTASERQAIEKALKDIDDTKKEILSVGFAQSKNHNCLIRVKEYLQAAISSASEDKDDGNTEWNFKGHCPNCGCGNCASKRADAGRDEKDGKQEDGNPPTVAGRRMVVYSNAGFERACLVHIQRLTHGIGDYDGAMMHTFCEAVRLCREYSDVMQGQRLEETKL